MIPTEEQRGALAHAINYIDETDLPVGELDGFDREVLRAMIDSSDPIPDVTELVELLAAGEHEQWAVWAQAILDSEPGLSDGRKAAWPEMIATPYENLSEELKDEDRRVVHLRSQAALDYIQQQSAEIERLRAENEGLSKAVIDIQEERDLAQAEFRSYHRAWEEQATRVQGLEEALVEMVATNPCNIPTLCDVVHDELMCPALDGNCDFWKGCPQKNELRAAARKQLHAEGKIGPDADAKPRSPQESDDLKHCHSCGKSIDEVKGNLCKGDYFIGSIFLDPGQEASRFDPPIDASYYLSCCDCARSWQITEERKAAIKELSELLTAIGCPSCHYYIQKNYGGDITVLRAMLTEADHDKP